MQRHTRRRVFKRRNVVKELIFNFFFTIASRPRLLLEVFIRQKMGRRYFRISSACTVVIILFILPIIITQKDFLFGVFNRHLENSSFLGKYGTWYLFIALFVFFCVRRYKETYPQGNVYDYDYFSLSSGYSHPLFENPPFLAKKPSGYVVEVFIEPAFFFLIGLMLIFLDQPLGEVFIFSSICYGFSYAAAYSLIDEEIQDTIDQIIDGEEFDRSFVGGFEASRGVKNYPRPTDEDLRRKMASTMFPPQDEPEDAEFTVL